MTTQPKTRLFGLPLAIVLVAAIPLAVTVLANRVDNIAIEDGHVGHFEWIVTGQKFVHAAECPGCLRYQE
jgi:hypothetical protein